MWHGHLAHDSTGWKPVPQSPYGPCERLQIYGIYPPQKPHGLDAKGGGETAGQGGQDLLLILIGLFVGQGFVGASQVQ
jgi:hypothetical protein